MRKAQIINGIVTNIVVVDPTAVPNWCANWPDATDEKAEIGGAFVNGVFTRPAPTPTPVPQVISFSQLLIGLVTMGWITEAEGEAWIAGVLPQSILSVIETLPVSQRFAAKARALRPSTVERDNQLLNIMAEKRGVNPAGMDEFFRTFARA